MSDEPLNLPIRPRRLRDESQLRQMTQRVVLRRSDFILPVFVTEGQNIRREIPSMPGVFQMSIDVATQWLSQRADEGFLAYLAFGLIDRGKKDAVGSEALNADNVVCQLFRAVAKQKIPMAGDKRFMFLRVYRSRTLRTDDDRQIHSIE